ncbi:MAG: ADP-forming succinate--CoA ligase subunit beta [Thermoplasmata archaeon]|nr:MAG: ADP-forming succinate--CoA ligase subunit beta [Thermoplasmata archaeon]
MKLYEYQAKEIFRQYGIPVPEGYVIDKVDDIKKHEESVVLKAQVLVGGRGKAGGIKIASGTDEAKKIASELLGAQIKGVRVKKLLIEKKLDIERELYLSIILDRRNKCPLLMFSEEGGVDIESVDEEKIIKLYIDPLIGIQGFMIRYLLKKCTLEQKKELGRIIKQLYRIFKEKDCELVEINPLVVDRDGKLWAADAKIIVDTDALYRHPEIEENVEESTDLEREAKKMGYALIELDGDIAVIANGAGLTMATLDAITHFGAKPRIFLDLGGTDDPEIVKNAFYLVKKSNPKAVLVNIFGGVTKCDTVAKGIVAALEEYPIDVPMIVRISGVHEDVGRKMLEARGVECHTTMLDAVKRCAEVVVKGGGK